MRTLGNEDVFAIGRILSKANLKEEIKKVTVGKNITTEKDAEQLGFDLLFTILVNCSDETVETEIFKLLASLFECDIEEVRKMNPIETFKKIKEVADWKEWKAFFSFAAKSMK